MMRTYRTASKVPVHLQVFVIEDNATIRENLIGTLEELTCVHVAGVSSTETDALSVTRTVKLLGPGVPVTPEIVPPAARLNPGGSDPLTTVHVYGGDPPEAASTCE